MEYYLAVRRHEVMTYAMTCLDIENTLIEKARHKRPRIISHSYEVPRTGKSTDRKQVSGCQRLGEGRTRVTAGWYGVSFRADENAVEL